MITWGTEFSVAGVMFAAAFVSGLAGFAFALIALGLLFQLVPPLAAVPLVLAGSLVAQVISLYTVREGVQWPRLWPFLVGGLLGIPLGAALLRGVDPAGFRLGLGAFLIGYSLYMLARRGALVVIGENRVADGAVGLVGGVMGGLAGLSGALPTVWCGMRGWTRGEQRGVYQPYIFVMQIAALAWIGATLAIPDGTGRLFLACLPGTVLGTWLGIRLYNRIGDVMFRRVVLGLLLLSGVVLVL